MNRLSDQTVVITGGAGSIGKTTARLFLDEGARVLLTDLKEEALRKAIEELGADKPLNKSRRENLTGAIFSSVLQQRCSIFKEN